MFLGGLTFCGLVAAANAQTVINAGHGGDNTRNLLKRLEVDVLSKQPSLVILLVGSNDALNSKNSVELDEYRRNLKSLISQIKSSSAKVLLVTQPPCYAPYVIKRHSAEFFNGKDPNQKLEAVRDAGEAVAKDEGVPVVELWSVFGEISKTDSADSLMRNVANSRSEDGVHPTPAGYQAMADQIAKGIREHALPTEKIVCFGDSLTFGPAVKGSGTSEGETYPARLLEILKTPASTTTGGN
jgi:lysophospholipase L1-like esterase